MSHKSKNVKIKDKIISLKDLQKDAFELRKKMNVMNPKFHDLDRCYNCKELFTTNDKFDFYSDKNNEYCKHQECPIYKYIYKFEKKDLELLDN